MKEHRFLRLSSVCPISRSLISSVICIFLLLLLFFCFYTLDGGRGQIIGPDYCGIEIEVHPLKTLESNIQERGGQRNDRGYRYWQNGVNSYPQVFLIVKFSSQVCLTRFPLKSCVWW